MKDERFPFLEVKDRQVIFTKGYGEIIIKEKFFEQHLAEFIGSKIKMFGVFKLFVWENEDVENEKPKKYQFMFPSKIVICPESINSRKDESGGKEYVLSFYRNSIFIDSTLVERSMDTSTEMINLLFFGYIPTKHVGYDDLPVFWKKCDYINDVNLNVVEVVRDIVISELCRNPEDYSKEFRLYLRDKMSKGDLKSSDIKNLMYNYKMVPISSIPRYNSAFSSITAADAKHGITVSVIRNREKIKNNISPIEDIIFD